MEEPGFVGETGDTKMMDEKRQSHLPGPDSFPEEKGIPGPKHQEELCGQKEPSLLDVPGERSHDPKDSGQGHPGPSLLLEGQGELLAVSPKKNADTEPKVDNRIPGEDDLIGLLRNTRKAGDMEEPGFVDETGDTKMMDEKRQSHLPGPDLFPEEKRNSDGLSDVSAPFTLISETMASKADDKEMLQRGNWGGKLEFILTCVGYAVGLGNVWRFPYLAFKNGGGAFLIPYWIIQLFVGMPLFFLELSFGQFASLGPLAIWEISPVFKGIGIASVSVSAFIGLYYNVIIGYCFFYFFASMSDPLPWAEELSVNSTNTTGQLNQTLSAMNETMSKSERYFFETLLGISEGLEVPGNVRWELALCLLLAWVVVLAVLSKGIKSLGKVVYFTATFPYLLLTALLVRGATLDGSSDGIYYYLTPDWDRLTDSNVWSDAATQVFFSLSACSGGLVLMASFNKFDNFCLRDALIVPLIDCLTSFFSGFVIFTVLGAMAKAKGVDVADVARGGTGLAFIVYPEAISQMPAPTVWAILFFFMMLIIGFSSQFSIMETVICSIIDEFPEVLRKNWKNSTLFRLAICVTFYLLALPMTTNGGIYLLELLDSSVSGFPLLFVGLFECITLCYVYGYNRLASDIEMMLGRKPWIYWQACWCFITPMILLSVIVFKSYQYTPISFGDYQYPDWGVALWWVVCMIPILAIPCWALYRFLAVGVKAFPAQFRPSPDWGPASPENRTGRYAPQLPTEQNGVTPINKAAYETKRWDKDLEKSISYGNLRDARSPHVYKNAALYETKKWDKDIEKSYSYSNLKDARSPHVYKNAALYETKRWDKDLQKQENYGNLRDARSPPPYKNKAFEKILDMTENEVEMLARHLGHDTKTHKENYRLSHSTRELTKVSQLLIAVESGFVNKWKGKKLSEISVDDLCDQEASGDNRDESRITPDQNTRDQNTADNDLCDQETSGDNRDKSRIVPDQNTRDQNTADNDLCDQEASGDNRDESGITPDQNTRDQITADNDLCDQEASEDNRDESRITPDQNTGDQNTADNGKRCIKRRWTEEELDFLRKRFKGYILGINKSVHQSELQEAQRKCPTRTLPQIRTKLNNMKLGKST